MSSPKPAFNYKENKSGPWATVPELLFEKVQLIPALQELLISYQPPAR